MDLPLALMILNYVAGNINLHGAIHLHNNMSLYNFQHFNPARNPRIAGHGQKARAHLRHQIWAGHEPVRDEVHRDIHPHGLPGLGLARWASGLADHHTMIVQRSGGVPVLERRQVWVFDGHVSSQRHVGSGLGYGIVN